MPETVHDRPAQSNFRDGCGYNEIQIQRIQPPDGCKQIGCCFPEIPPQS